MADSSYLVDSLLGGVAKFEEEQMLVPDFAVAEAMNAFYVQERVLRVIDDGRPYVRRLFLAMEAGAVEVVGSSKDVILDAYEIGVRHKAAPYDCIFVALALRLGKELRTRDRRQAEIMASESARRGGGSRAGGAPT